MTITEGSIVHRKGESGQYLYEVVEIKDGAARLTRPGSTPRLWMPLVRLTKLDHGEPAPHRFVWRVVLLLFTLGVVLLLSEEISGWCRGR